MGTYSTPMKARRCFRDTPDSSLVARHRNRTMWVCPVTAILKDKSGWWDYKM